MIQYEDLKKNENVRLDNILLIQFKDLKLKLKKNTDFFHVNKNEECKQCQNNNENHIKTYKNQIQYYEKRYQKLLNKEVDVIFEFNYINNSVFNNETYPSLSVSLTTLSGRKEFIFISKHIQGDFPNPGSKNDYLYNDPGSLFGICFDYLINNHFEGIKKLDIWNISGKARTDGTVTKELLFFYFLTLKHDIIFEMCYLAEGHYALQKEMENGLDLLKENNTNFKMTRNQFILYSLNLTGCSSFGFTKGKTTFSYFDKKIVPKIYGLKEEGNEEKNHICNVCSKTENLKKCSKCKSVYYCGYECQKADWNSHKKTCS
jgi:hypothetical protein